MAVRFTVGNEGRAKPPPDYAEQLAESTRSVERIEFRRDEEAFALRRYVTGRLARIPTGVYDVRRIELLLYIARQIYQTGDQLVRAVEPVAHAVHLARQSGDDRMLRKALTTQGVILINLDNLGDALLCLEEAAHMAKRLPDDFEENFAVIANTATAMFQAFMVEDAQKMFRQAEALAVAAGDVTKRAQVLSNLAACALETREFDEGLALIREAIRIMHTPRSIDELAWRALTEANFICLLLHAGREAEARERNVFAKYFAAKSGARRAELAAQGADGLCEMIGGAVEAGRDLVSKALESSRSLPLSLRSALLTAVQACEAIGDFGEALAYQHELTLLIAKQKEANTWASVRGDSFAFIEGRQAERCSELRAAWLFDAAARGDEAYLVSQALNADGVRHEDGSHADRVGTLARRLAGALGLDEDFCWQIESAARLHDVGMKAVPRVITLKSRSLSSTERAALQKHCADGADLVARCEIAYRRLAAEVARSHHEHWDGTGYPDRLRGEEIPFAARIVALADAFDSMTHDRAYGAALAREAALAEIERELGTHFDPHIGSVFIKLLAETHVAQTL